MVSQLRLEMVIGFRAAGEQQICPCQSHLVVLGKLAVMVVVGDGVDKIFGETGLTGLVEADLASKATIGDPGVSQPHELFDVEIDVAV